MTFPLEDVRILDLTQTLSGPYGTMILGDLGAEVIKIEGPQNVDPARVTPPHFLNGVSLYFISLNRNKKSLVLDLKQPLGRQAFYELVQISDVVCENFRPGVAVRLGIDYTTVKQHNPSIIYSSVSGFGHTGPLRDQPGYDHLMQALSGLLQLTGEPAGPPTKAGISIADLVTGLYEAIAVMAALHLRQQSGLGQQIDLALLDCQMSLLTYLAANYLSTGEAPRRQADSAHPYLVPSQNFRTADGWIVLSVLNDNLWPPFCHAIDRPDLLDDPRFNSLGARFQHREELIPLLKEALARRSTEEWLHKMERAGVPAAPILTIDQALGHPQVKARELIVDLQHPAYGSARVVGSPIKFNISGSALAPAPAFGEHTYELIAELLGYSADMINDLRRQQTIA